MCDSVILVVKNYLKDRDRVEVFYAFKDTKNFRPPTTKLTETLIKQMYIMILYFPSF